eukprot:TRINITY_DN10015_c0_g1_i3.p1 TRINITY_DN10015_c0_g1~~TRINITY_DN10015_c0_g1_i3.p1  ORF type:complete len:460 (-),score=32.36 TRINITY_DN10015_c0_g1_i3:45-1424(-)
MANTSPSFMDCLSRFSESYKIFVRPRRKVYSLSDLGAREFVITSGRVVRHDFTVQNVQGKTLFSSLFIPRMSKPCTTVIVFLHQNGGARVDCLPLLEHVLPQNFALLTFDFSGSGQSEGDWVTLGYNERDDVTAVLTHMGKVYANLENIVLWGRSMGAATALMVASKASVRIKAVIADSPFASLSQVSLAHMQGCMAAPLPSFILKLILELVRNQIIKNVGIDLFELSPKDDAKNINIPVLIGVARGDELTKPEQVREIFDSVKEKTPFNRFVEFEGDHASPRPGDFYHQAIHFLNEVFASKKKEGIPLVTISLQGQSSSNKTGPQRIASVEVLPQTRPSINSSGQATPRQSIFGSQAQDFSSNAKAHSKSIFHEGGCQTARAKPNYSIFNSRFDALLRSETPSNFDDSSKLLIESSYFKTDERENQSAKKMIVARREARNKEPPIQVPKPKVRRPIFS